MMAYDVRIDTECNKIEDQKYEINKNNLLFLAIETEMHLLLSPFPLPAIITAHSSSKTEKSKFMSMVQRCGIVYRSASLHSYNSHKCA